MSVEVIDCQYLQPEFAAAFLLTEGEGAQRRAAFVETNTAHSVPLLLAALKRAGLTPEQVDYVIITHVHLDHAGGAQALMKACPNARLLAHPRAAPHVIDPSKLVASARIVYGAEAFEKLYGEIGPIPAERVRAMEDGETLRWGERTLRFLHTRGHANHHFVIHDSGSDAVFTGDSFGLRYPQLQKHGLFIFPSTSPTDFEPALAQESVRRIVATGARRAFLTHFGEVPELVRAEAQLLEHLRFSEALLGEAIASPLSGEPLRAFCERRLREHYEAFVAREKLGFDRADWELIRLDLELNAQGIVFVAQKRRAQKGS
ncbi:MAG: MBL fold metallo-hydrolase [Oligoflexia bacterium]|nr:MBL fold metallo-hydrolase [Oligoflexia bacterium]